MPYRRRSSASSSWRRRNKRRTSRYYRRKGSRSQAGQLVRLDKRLTKLTKKVSLNRDYFNYYNFHLNVPLPQFTDATNTYGYSCIPVLDTASGNFAPCFDEPTRADLDIDTWMYHGSKVHLRIDIDTENTNPCEVSVFLVTIRPEYQATAISNWGNKLQNMMSPALPDSETPTSSSPNPIMCFSTGQTFINQKVFKVHRFNRKNIGEVGYGSGSVPVRNIGDTVFNLSYNIKKRVKLARSQNDIIDALTDTNGAINRNAQSFILMVSDNSAFDAGLLKATATILHTFSAQS